VRPGQLRPSVGHAVLPPGWHLTSPLHRPEVLADEGEGALSPLPVSSREGVRGTAKLSFRFHADVPALAESGHRSGRWDFNALLERTASEALQQTLTGRSAADFLNRAALETPLTIAVAAALGAWGCGCPT